MVWKLIMLAAIFALAAGTAQASTILFSHDTPSYVDANGKGYSAGDSLLAQASDTSVVFNIKQLTNLSAWVQANCDSTTIAVQTSMDGTVWRTFLSATYFGGTKGTVVGIFHKFLNLTGSTGTDYFGCHLGNQLRIILKNNDSLTGTAARAGVKSLKYYVQGTSE